MRHRLVVAMISSLAFVSAGRTQPPPAVPPIVIPPAPVVPAQPTVPPVIPAPTTPEPTPAMPVAPAPTHVAPTYPTKVLDKDLEAWLKDLKESPDGAARELAVKAIPLFGPAARKPALKPLINALGKDNDPGVRMNILLLLGMIGAETPEEARTITDALSGIIVRAGVGSPVRLHATRSLGNYGPAAASAIGNVIAIADDVSWETRHAVVAALAQLGRPPDEKRVAVPVPAAGGARPPNAPDPVPVDKKFANPSVLKQLLYRLEKDESAQVRLEATHALLMLGPPAFNKDIPTDYERQIKPFLDTTLARMKVEKDKAVQVWLYMLHMRYDGRAYNDGTVAKIADYINKPETTGQVAALRALALLGGAAKPALPTMIAALRNPDQSLVAEAAIALSAMRGEAKEALPELERIKAMTTDAMLKEYISTAIDLIAGKKPGAPAAAVAAPKK